MEFKITKDIIAGRNKMLLILNKIKKIYKKKTARKMESNRPSKNESLLQ